VERRGDWSAGGGKALKKQLEVRKDANRVGKESNQEIETKKGARSHGGTGGREEKNLGGGANGEKKMGINIERKTKKEGGINKLSWGLFEPGTPPKVAVRKRQKL